MAAHAPSSSALQKSARAEMRSLAATLKMAASCGSVHGARRQIKRLRSLLRLLREELGEEAFGAANSALRGMADALAGQRRAEALVLAADRLSGRGRAYWQKAAEAHRDDHNSGRATNGGLPAAQSLLAAAVKAIPAPSGEAGSCQTIERAFLLAYRKARRQLAKGFASGDAEQLHTARKHVIHHLHHVELLGDHLRHAERRAKALDTLREALGDLNDLDELTQIAAESGRPPPEAALRAMVKRRVGLLRRAEKAAARLFRHKPEVFRKCIGAMWPADSH